MLTSEQRIRALPVWRGAITIAPLKGGLSNESWLVRDAAGQHVVRFGKDYRSITAQRETMRTRAHVPASPEVHYSEPASW